MAGSDDADTLAQELESERLQIRRQMRRLVGAHDLSVRIFYGGDGQLTEAATQWLDELGAACFADKPTYDPDPRAHAFNEGRRAVFLEIMHGLRLDQRRLAALSRQLREADDDD